ncbi:MAG: ABC-three component system protein, partial [Methyloligellaceae bacterium]
MSDQSDFEAPHSMLGYIYQVRYALLLALKKIEEVEDPDQCIISIENLDDILFEKKGDPFELLQTKYHGSPGNLTDRSTDLWKTIRVWSEFSKSTPENQNEAVFSLISTENAENDSLASLLSTAPDKRDTTAALNRMREICEETTNASNKAAYASFRALSDVQQEKMISSSHIICNSPDITQVDALMKRKIRMSVQQEHVDAFISRLEGRWFREVIDELSSSPRQGINLGDIIEIVDELRPQFLPNNLPVDFETMDPAIIDAENDDRIFVQQLRLIGAKGSVLETAIVNYYRAYEQRSRWARENLTKPGEVKAYLDKLQDEWNDLPPII